MEAIGLYQIILGALTLAAALGVVFSRNPVVSAMCLMATLFTTGALYFGLGSFFIGAVQILIYAGAISVLFVFIVMLLDLKPTFVRIPGAFQKGIVLGLGGALLGLALFMAYNGAVTGLGVPDDAAVVDASSAKSISLYFLTKHMLPFQLTGLLLFAAVIGVILIGRAHDPRSVKGHSK